MRDGDSLFECFEASRPRLKAAAYGFLGMLDEADEVLRAAHVRLARRDAGDIREPYDWLLADVVRDCLARLRVREAHQMGRQSSWVPDPIVTRDDSESVEHGDRAPRPATLRQLVGLYRLNPGERVAFVLHELLGEPVARIAAIAGMHAVAVEHFIERSHGRQFRWPAESDDLRSRRREFADSFFQKWKAGQYSPIAAAFFFGAGMHIDLGPLLGRTVSLESTIKTFVTTGTSIADDGWAAHQVLVNGEPGFLVMDRFRTRYVVGLGFQDDSIRAVFVLGDLERIRRLDLPKVDELIS